MSFKRFDPEDFIVSADSVVAPAWSGNIGTLTTFYTSSVQQASTSATYYLDVYKDNPQTTSSADVQFSIAYANKTGGGAVPYNSTITGSTHTSTLYGQMRTLLLEDENSDFYFGSGTNIITGSDFYVINVNRSHYKEKLMPGTWNIQFDDGYGQNQAPTLVLTDNSRIVSLPSYYGTQRVYQIVQGYNGSGSMCPGYGSYGLFFPDTSLFLLNAKALDDLGNGLNLQTSRVTSSMVHNEKKLLPFLNPVGGNFSGEFILQSEETITSNYVFVRARNSEFNYSENPSYISGSTGEVLHSSFIDNPQTYPTTIGLYNDSNELLAVGKLSKPLLKDSTKELLLRMKIDF